MKELIGLPGSVVKMERDTIKRVDRDLCANGHVTHMQGVERASENVGSWKPVITSSVTDQRSCSLSVVQHYVFK